MAVTIRCPNPDCGRAHQVVEAKLGRRGRCRKCGTRFTLEPAAATAQFQAARETHEDSNPALSLDETGVTQSQGVAGTQADSRATQPASSGGSSAVGRLGRFEIRARLGSGAFGTVYRAHDPQLDREVALKVPHAARVADPKSGDKFVKRFLNEAKAAARLQHPHIVPVFDAGNEGQRYYIAAAFIEGEPLDKELDNRQFNYHDTARIVMQLAEALAYAHKQGIVHRDVKPANVMLDTAAEPHVMDFGLARLETSDEKLTQDGGVLGTPAYMSPEQARADVDEVGPASDQYSLGVLLYEMLCGQTPFSGPPEIVIFNVIQMEPPAPRVAKPAIPRDLETICLKAMSKVGAARYADCEEFAADLRRWLDDEPIHARRISPVERFTRWCRRNPVVAGLTAAVFLVVAVGLIATTWQWGRAVAETKRADAKAAEAVEQSQAARREGDRARQASRRALRIGYVAQMSLIQADWDTENIDRLRERLEQTRPEQTGGEDLRGFEWYYWHRLCHSDPSVKVVSSVASLAFSPDGKCIASCVGGTVKVYDAGVLQELMTLKVPVKLSGATPVVFSSDGSRIAAAAAEIKVWDAGSGVDVASLKVEKGFDRNEPQGCIAVSPDGSRVAVGNRRGTVRVWDVDSGEDLLTVWQTRPDQAGFEREVRCLTFSPDGDRLASGHAHGWVIIRDVSTRELHLNLDVGRVTSLAFSPNGRFLATSGGPTKIWDAESGQELLTLQEDGGNAGSMAFSSDSRRIVVVGSSTFKEANLRERSTGWSKLWDAESGLEVLTRRYTDTDLSKAILSADGTRIAYVRSGSVRLIDAYGGREIQPPKASILIPGNSRRWILSADGRWIAADDGRSAGSTTKVMDAATGREIFSTSPGGSVNAMALSPDGDRIAVGVISGGVYTLKIWDTQKGDELLNLMGAGGELFFNVRSTLQSLTRTS